MVREEFLANTAESKLRRFFLDNPDEELTLDQIAVKFNVSKRTVWNASSRLQEEGMLELVSVLRMRPKA